MTEIELARKILKHSVFFMNLLKEDAEKHEEMEDFNQCNESRRLLADLKEYYENYVCKQFTMRKMTFQDVLDDKEVTELEVVKTDSIESLHDYAQNLGYDWKSSRKYIFGGYYYMKPTKEHRGDCLLIV